MWIDNNDYSVISMFISYSKGNIEKIIHTIKQTDNLFGSLFDESGRSSVRIFWARHTVSSTSPRKGEYTLSLISSQSEVDV